jgi:nucleotide-binding universal stress UspA family protein
MLRMRDRPQVLVPFDGSPAAERLLRAACQASLREWAPLVVLCMVPIPAGRAADETPSNVQLAVMRALVQAQAICREEGVIALFRETYATDLAAEILSVADDMHASVIAMSLDEWTNGDEADETVLMSPIVQRVLAGAHCTVMLGTEETPIAANPASGRDEE